jgi:perosamine synthetase
MIPAAKPIIGDEEREAVDRVLRSGMITSGPEVAAFESEFSAHVGGRHCVAMNSGTSALHLALIAMGIGAGDEVIIPSFSFAATANSVALTGATPVFADIDRATFNLDPDAARAAITPRTKAIMPVHLYGQMAQMGKFESLAQEYGLQIIEDAAQSHIASIDGRNAGEWGITACFSFYPTKNMTSGEGGMVVTPDEKIARMLRLLRNQGMEQRYKNEVIGFNTRMTDIHAAIGRVQLRKLPAWTKQRQANAAFLDANLKGVVVPPVTAGASHVYHQYTVRVPVETGEQRDAFITALAKKEVGSGVYYPTPIHRLPSFDLLLDLPETELAARQVISLPVHPALSTDDLKQIAEAVSSTASELV